MNEEEKITGQSQTQSLDLKGVQAAVEGVRQLENEFASQELQDSGSLETSLDTVIKLQAGSLENMNTCAEVCTETSGGAVEDYDDRSWICAICMDHIPVEETAQVKGCEHLYCVSCILRWSTYKQNPWCPQCRLPFTMLYSYRSISGEMSDIMQAEPICLLLLAPWFKKQLPAEEEEEEYYPEEEEDSDEETLYVRRLGNRRWGENGYVRNGRMEARPRVSPSSAGGSGSGRGASSSTRAKGNSLSSVLSREGDVSGEAEKPLGRRAKRAQERAAAEGGTRGGGGGGRSRQQSGRVGVKG